MPWDLILVPIFSGERGFRGVPFLLLNKDSHQETTDSMRFHTLFMRSKAFLLLLLLRSSMPFSFRKVCYCLLRLRFCWRYSFAEARAAAACNVVINSCTEVRLAYDFDHGGSANNARSCCRCCCCRCCCWSSSCLGCDERALSLMLLVRS